MKLERFFEVKNGLLFTMDGTEVPVSSDMVKSVKWSDVEPEPEAYNESYLADLRTALKNLEEEKKFVVIEPVVDKDYSDEAFIAAMSHTARRIKDCVSVIGFAIPEKFATSKDEFMAELLRKHGHYCFFSKTGGSEELCGY